MTWRGIYLIRLQSGPEVKIIPGFILILLNDTNLSEFLSLNAVSLPVDRDEQGA